MRTGSAKSAATRVLAEVPRPVWRRLLTPPRLVPGARVLIVAPQPNSLAEWFAELSFDVVAASEDADCVLDGRRSCPQAEFLRATPGQRLYLPLHSFDAAFVQPLSDHAGSWLSSTARAFTAGVLAALKPQGRLHWWRRRSPTSDHADACWSQHIGCFPGRVETAEVSDSLLSDSLWAWMRRREPATSTIVVTLQTPPEPLTFDDWRNHARRGLLTDRRACCSFAESAETGSAARRAA